MSDTELNPDSSLSPRQRGKHYYESVVIEVEGILHRVPRHGLEECSSVFRDMFSMPQGTDDGQQSSREGDTDDNPIKLVGCTNEEFESLMEVVYQLVGKPPDLSKERWIGVLKIARLWDMPQVAELAIEKISDVDMSPIEMVKLGKDHGVPNWLKVGYTALVGDLADVSLSDMASLGLETAFRILWARDELAKSRMSRLGGFYIEKEKISCGTCWRNWGTVVAIDESASSCGNCGNSYDYADHGVHINLPYTSLNKGPPEATMDTRIKAAVIKVTEMFGEEIKDAENRNAVVTAA